MTVPPAAPSRRRSRSHLAALFAVLLVAGACGAEDDVEEAVTSTTEVSTTVERDDDESPASTDPPRSGDAVRSVVQSADGDLTLAVESSAAEIWTTTTRDDVCSPAEPAVAVFEADLEGSAASEVTGMRAFFRPDEGDEGEGDGDGGATDGTAATTVAGGTDDAGTPPGTRTVDFAVDDDGTWRAVVGPFEARSRQDRLLDVTVVARTDDGVSTQTELELLVRAPVRCASGERPDRTRRAPAPVELSVATTPADARIVGTGAEDCDGRPDVLGVRIDASGAVVAMSATLTLPDGSTVSRSFDGRGSRVVRSSLGPVAAPSGDAATARLVVSATDVYGTTVVDSTTVTVLRPVPCDSPDATSTTVVGDDADQGDEVDEGEVGDLSVSFSPDPPLVWATGTGRCPAGSTTLSIRVVAPAAVESISVSVRTADGQTSTTSLSRSGGRWQGTVGPFAGWSGMPANSDLGVRIVASGGGTVRSVDESARLRRSDRCGSETTEPPATDPATTIASTVPATTSPASPTPPTPPSTAAPSTAAPTTAAPTTAAPTTAPPPPPPSTAAPTTAAPTTAAPPPPPQLTNVAATPNPVACGANVTIGARTSGTVDRVGVSLGGANRQMGGGGGQWTLSATAPGAAGSYPVSVTAQGAGQSSSSSFSLTVTC